MTQRASVYVVRHVPTDGGEWPNQFRPRITVEVRVFFPPHTPLTDVAGAFGEVAAEVVGGIAGYVDTVPRNVWLLPPITTYSKDEIAAMDDFAREQNEGLYGE